MFGQPRRRWANIKIALGECLVLACMAAQRSVRNRKLSIKQSMPFGFSEETAYKKDEQYRANMVHSTNAGLMLGQRRRRWPNISPALGKCSMFSG